MNDAATPLPSEVAAESRTTRSPYRTPPGRPPRHGGAMLTRVLRTVRLDTIDRRSQVGVALRRLKAEFVAQLGGEDVMTPALNLLVEEACKKAVIVEVIGNYILTQDTLVREHPEHGPQLLRVVEQHDRLQATLGNLLDRIGYERKAAPVEDFASYVARRDAERSHREA